jgi:hypothetical protein
MGSSKHPEGGAMETLDIKTKLQLLRFVCAFGWSDLEMHPAEREAILAMMEKLEVTAPDERHKVAEWLSAPPEADEVDPQSIPKEKRDLFLAECHAIIEADGVLRSAEQEAITLLRRILGRG